MTSWQTWDYRCEKCDHIETHLQDREDVSDYEYCVVEGCSGQAYKMYGGHVSTSKTSASIPDGVNKRFSKIREQQKARKALSQAKQTGDRAGATEARAEIKKISRSKS